MVIDADTLAKGRADDYILGKPQITPMKKQKISVLTILLAAFTIGAAQAQTNLAPGAAADTNKVFTAVPKPSASSQSDVASKTAQFGKVAKTDDAYKQALDAHELAAGLKLVDKEGSLKGKVSKIFEPRGGALAILNFDENYRSALTAIVRSENFSKFPDLKALVGKTVLLKGKFIEYHGAAEMVLTSPDQVKVVEMSAANP